MSQRTSAALQDDMQALQTRVALEESRLASDVESSSPWHLSCCRLSETQKLHFRALLSDSSRFSRKHVEELRKQAAVAPGIPDMEFRLRLNACAIDMVHRPPGPAWLRDVCWRRGHFSGCIFVLPGCTGGLFFSLDVGLSESSDVGLGLFATTTVADAGGGPFGLAGSAFRV